jgi:hypothetical protein
VFYLGETPGPYETVKTLEKGKLLGGISKISRVLTDCVFGLTEESMKVIQTAPGRT